MRGVGQIATGVRCAMPMQPRLSQNNLIHAKLSRATRNNWMEFSFRRARTRTYVWCSSKRYHYLLLAESERCVHYYFRVAWHMLAAHCSWWALKCEKYFIYENRWMGRSADSGMMRNDIVSHDLYKRSDVYRLDSALCSRFFHWRKLDTERVSVSAKMSNEHHSVRSERVTHWCTWNWNQLSEQHKPTVVVLTMLTMMAFLCTRFRNVIRWFTHIHTFMFFSRHILACSVSLESQGRNDGCLLNKNIFVKRTEQEVNENSRTTHIEQCDGATFARCACVCAHCVNKRQRQREKFECRQKTEPKKTK